MAVPVYTANHCSKSLGKSLLTPGGSDSATRPCHAQAVSGGVSYHRGDSVDPGSVCVCVICGGKVTPVRFFLRVLPSSPVSIVPSVLRIQRFEVAVNNFENRGIGIH
jgi:hypothetical protein